MVNKVFTPPTLTANGTLGGNSFAVAASNESDGAAYNAINDNYNSWLGKGGYPAWFVFYNPEPLTIDGLSVVAYGDLMAFNAYQLQISEDGSNWTTIYSGNSGYKNEDSWQTFTIDLTEVENRTSKYWRFYLTSPAISTSKAFGITKLIFEDTIEGDVEPEPPVQPKNNKAYVFRRKTTKYYQEDINYTKVGSVAVNDNHIVSNFSTSNYLNLNNSYKSNNNAEYIFKFTTANNVTTGQRVVHAEKFLNIEIYNSVAVVYNWGNKKDDPGINVSANTTYWFKIKINGNNKTLSYSTDGVNYIGEKTFVDSGMQPSSTSYGFRLGLSSYDSSRPFLGSIDLNESYIKIGDGEKQYLYSKKEVDPTVIYKDYALPQMTSNTAPEGTVATNVSVVDYSNACYNVFFGGEWYFWAEGNTGSKYAQYTFPHLLEPDIYTLSLQSKRQPGVTTNPHNWYLVYEDGTKETILNYGLVPNTEVSGYGSYSGSLVATKKVKAIRYEINVSYNNRNRGVEYIKNLNLTSENGLRWETFNYNVKEIKEKSYATKRKIQAAVSEEETNQEDKVKEIIYLPRR